MDEFDLTSLDSLKNKTPIKKVDDGSKIVSTYQNDDGTTTVLTQQTKGILWWKKIDDKNYEIKTYKSGSLQSSTVTHEVGDTVYKCSTKFDDNGNVDYAVNSTEDSRTTKKSLEFVDFNKNKTSESIKLNYDTVHNATDIQHYYYSNKVHDPNITICGYDEANNDAGFDSAWGTIPGYAITKEEYEKLNK